MLRRAALALLFIPAAALAQGEWVPAAGDLGAPPVPREFRAAWIASVANIDWPSEPGLPAWRQQAELLALLDRAAALGLNAVVLQVRPAADALYPSRLEPWSEYLTGEMGVDPEYDPLAFAVAAAHERGLELHAWFNPYRARHPSASSPAAPAHVARTRPRWVRRYGTSLWLDPGDPSARRHSVRVIADVVRRYDVDAVHIDDYFYPYPERAASGTLIPFPDGATYARYRRSGGRLGRDDWRRANVDRLVREIRDSVRAVKPWVRFGISPFGIWRPGHPEQIRGFDPYDRIYADARRWLREGWVDYLAPQLYWAVDSAQQSFPVLLRWWTQQNRHGRHVWPGLYTSRVAGADGRTWPAQEIITQVRLTREQPGATGHIHFSMTALAAGPDGLAARLAAEAYAAPALVPASPWLDRTAPARPAASAAPDSAGGLRLDLAPGGKEEPWLWVVRARTGGTWATRLVPGVHRSHVLLSRPGEPLPDAIVVTAVDRVGNESRPAALVPHEPSPVAPVAGQSGRDR